MKIFASANEFLKSQLESYRQFNISKETCVFQKRPMYTKTDLQRELANERPQITARVLSQVHFLIRDLSISKEIYVC